MDINCIVASQKIPATGFKQAHCFIRGNMGVEERCSNYSDLIRIREVTWMELRGEEGGGN